MAVPQGINQRWSLDFASDALTDGRRFRILAVIDGFNRECVGLIAGVSLSGVRVARELDKIAARVRTLKCQFKSSAKIARDRSEPILAMV